MKFASIGLRAVCRRARSIDGSPVNAMAGFTLLETLIAMAVLAIALVSLFDAQERALVNAGVAADYANARILAQALLAESESGWNGSPVSGSGSEGRFAWSIVAAPERTAWSAISSKQSWRLNRIQVNVSWDKNRHIELDGLKLGRPNE
jgi:prepilin-type N-terminal cleavage/methylation domain-containing protein